VKPFTHILSEKCAKKGLMTLLDVKSFNQTQKASVWIAGLLGLALFLSPIQLHNNPASAFYNIQSPVHHNHTSHHESSTDSDSAKLQCLRCVLYGFFIPEVIAPSIVTLIILGVLTLAEREEPFSFFTSTNTARAPPL
jgi:hypothetical protein